MKVRLSHLLPSAPILVLYFHVFLELPQCRKDKGKGKVHTITGH